LGIGRFGVNGSDLLSAAVSGNVILRSGGNGFNQGQPSMQIGNGGDGQGVGTVTDVTVSGNTITDAIYDGVNVSTSTDINFESNSIIAPWRDGIVISPQYYPAPTGSGTFTDNSVTGLKAGMSAFINNSSGFVATLNGNSWQQSTPEGPYGGTPAAVPGTVRAENYDTGGQGAAYSVTSTNGTDNGYRSDGVDLETATSPATGNNLGWTGTGQWFRYTVNVATAGTYKVSFLVAGDVAVTDAFHLANSAGNDLTGAVAVPLTGGWQDWTTVTATVILPAGVQTLTLDEDNSGWNIDAIVFAAANAPFGGTPAAVPGTVMAENYDKGGQGVAYSVTSTNGTDNGYRSDGVDLETATSPAAGNDLGWTATGQWFKYTMNVAMAGTYTVSFFVAGDVAVSDAFHLSNATGTNLTGSVGIPSTGGWQNWTTVTAKVTLPAGTQTLTLDEDNAGWNIDSTTFAVE
jgi:hypothetical protein